MLCQKATNSHRNLERGFVIDRYGDPGEFFWLNGNAIDTPLAIEQVGKKGIFFLYKDRVSTGFQPYFKGAIAFADNFCYQYSRNAVEEAILRWIITQVGRIVNMDFANNPVLGR